MAIKFGFIKQLQLLLEQREQHGVPGETLTEQQPPHYNHQCCDTRTDNACMHKNA